MDKDDIDRMLDEVFGKTNPELPDLSQGPGVIDPEFMDAFAKLSPGAAQEVVSAMRDDIKSLALAVGCAMASFSVLGEALESVDPNTVPEDVKERFAAAEQLATKMLQMVKHLKTIEVNLKVVPVEVNDNRPPEEILREYMEKEGKDDDSETV